MAKYVDYISTELVKIPDHLWTRYTMDHMNLITSYVSGTVQPQQQEQQPTAAPSFPFTQSSPQGYRFPTQPTSYHGYMYQPLQPMIQQQQMQQPMPQQPMSQPTMMPPPSSPSTSLGTGYHPEFLPSPTGFTTSPGTSSYTQQLTPSYPALNTPRMMPISPETPPVRQSTSTTSTVTTTAEATSTTATVTSEVLSTYTMLTLPDND